MPVTKKKNAKAQVKIKDLKPTKNPKGGRKAGEGQPDAASKIRPDYIQKVR
jgi:hypothetical protein